MKGFEEWMESEEGLQSMEAMDYVSEMLRGAEVDIDENKIIWTDGQILTIKRNKNPGTLRYGFLPYSKPYYRMASNGV